jgi:hypothetical protein
MIGSIIEPHFDPDSWAPKSVVFRAGLQVQVHHLGGVDPKWAPSLLLPNIQRAGKKHWDLVCATVPFGGELDHLQAQW